MGNKVIAISGYPGSGKTTVCNYIKNNSDFICFDFGAFFRTLTYYFLYDKKYEISKIIYFIENDIKNLELSYKIEDNTLKIGVAGKYYQDDILNTPSMNIDTVKIGSIIKDRLNYKLIEIIDEIKKEHNILLNARRPVVVYPKLDKHIFLKADFESRVDRKRKMNKEDYDYTKDKLLKRDKIESSSGFFNIYDFTEVIDTTNLTIENAIDIVKDKVLDNKNINITYLNNLTLVLGSYKCDKNCPYCIAKANHKFENLDNIDNLDDIFKQLKENLVSFNRFVISGNGEPSLYDYSSLLRIKEVINKYRSLFKKFRIHSSGNIFFNDDKFRLFNGELQFEYEVLRVALESELDMSILGYKNDYLTSSNFINCNDVKCDIALTDYLNINNIKENVYTFLMLNPSIKTLRFKKLLPGDYSNEKRDWVVKHTLSDDDIKRIMYKLEMDSNNNVYKSSGGLIIYKKNGNYDKDLVINNGILKDYNHNDYNVKKLKREYFV